MSYKKQTHPRGGASFSIVQREAPSKKESPARTAPVTAKPPAALEAHSAPAPVTTAAPPTPVPKQEKQELWLDLSVKHKHTFGVAGNNKSWLSVLAFLRSGKGGVHVLRGPPGIGKTYGSVRAATFCDRRYIYVQCADLASTNQNKHNLRSELGIAATRRGFADDDEEGGGGGGTSSHRLPPVLILDDVDALGSDLTAQMTELLRSPPASTPILVTCGRTPPRWLMVGTSKATTHHLAFLMDNELKAIARLHDVALPTDAAVLHSHLRGANGDARHFLMELCMPGQVATVHRMDVQHNEWVAAAHLLHTDIFGLSKKRGRTELADASPGDAGDEGTEAEGEEGTEVAGAIKLPSWQEVHARRRARKTQRTDLFASAGQTIERDDALAEGVTAVDRLTQTQRKSLLLDILHANYIDPIVEGRKETFENKTMADIIVKSAATFSDIDTMHGSTTAFCMLEEAMHLVACVPTLCKHQKKGSAPRRLLQSLPTRDPTRQWHATPLRSALNSDARSKARFSN